MSIETIKQELKAHLINHIEDVFLYGEYDKEECIEASDIHHSAFNSDYYIIGFYDASKWLKKHEIGEFESIDLIKDYSKSSFVEFNLPENINSEWAVNQLVYFIGESIIYELFGDCETLEDFLKVIESEA